MNFLLYELETVEASKRIEILVVRMSEKLDNSYRKELAEGLACFLVMTLNSFLITMTHFQLVDWLFAYKFTGTETIEQLWMEFHEYSSGV